jgi:hypothetical protein
VLTACIGFALSVGSLSLTSTRRGGDAVHVAERGVQHARKVAWQVFHRK